MAQILIIDDDPRICAMLSDLILEQGHEPQAAHTLEDGLRKNRDQAMDVVLLDIHLPDGNGLKAIPMLKRGGAHPEVIIITGYGDQDGAELAITSGAWHYIQKRDSIQDIILSLRRVLEYRQSAAQSRTAPKVFKRCGIIGQSQALKRCIAKMAGAADTDANFMLTGETGTGKELFAYALHANSARAEGNFVVVDCTALPETLAESILFGHEKGAFTGAEKAREGLISHADGGTLFLDEICELSPTLQKVFLRVLQEKRFRPIGSKKEVTSDFRLVTATNRNPHLMVKENLFRKDLLYRIKTIDIELPPLRRRTEDVKAIAGHYLDKIVELNHLPPKGIAPDVVEVLCAYDWPGNIRELIATMENVVFKARDESILFTQHLPTAIRVAVARSGIKAEALNEKTPAAGQAGKRAALSMPPSLPPYKAYCEAYNATRDRAYFKRLMKAANQDIALACRISGLSRTQVYNQLKKNHIPRRQYNRQTG
jgi:two-component system, NtrC family, response regulator